MRALAPSVQLRPFLSPLFPAFLPLPVPLLPLCTPLLQHQPFSQAASKPWPWPLIHVHQAGRVIHQQSSHELSWLSHAPPCLDTPLPLLRFSRLSHSQPGLTDIAQLSSSPRCTLFS